MTPAEADAPRDMTLTADDGTPLAALCWRAPEPQGTLVLSHGVGEHAGCYDHLARRVARDVGLDVVGFDFRGHGRSPGVRGVVREYGELLGDLRGVLRAVAEAQGTGRPLFLLGHSNGGQVAARVAADPPVPLGGLILSNPAIALRVPVPRWKIWLGKALRQIAPHATLRTGLSDDQMTDDPSQRATRRDDPLRHNRISPALYFGMVEGRDPTLDAAPRLRLPALLILGERDPVVDLDVVREFFRRIPEPNRTLLSLPEMKHEPFNDQNREVPLRAVVSWLQAQLSRDVATAKRSQSENARF